VEALVLIRAKGCVPQQRNHYARGVRGLFRWLVREIRVGANPLDALGFDKATAEVIRHARRELTTDELSRLFDATRATTHTFRGLTGEIGTCCT
jgi:site-specific recombinase XerC